jgi:hypothetical protein
MPNIVIVDPSNGTASPDPIIPMGSPATIVFQLKDPSDWQWGTPPITVQNGGSEFPGGATVNGNGVSLTDRNQDNELYNYTVNATHKSGKKVSFDPSIQNQAER